jgi:hypothetical protein
LTVEVMMACHDDGTWAAMTTGREMPRQNGKGDEIEVPEFWGLVKLHEAILHTVHDAVLLATQAQERMLALFEHKDLRRLLEGGTVWKGTGQQMIRLSTGGQVWYRTRTGGGGRGIDQIDRLVVDEAQHATNEQLAAVSSTLMIAPDPQLNAIGTAGLDGKSGWWWNIRKRALSAKPGSFGYVGHTAETVRMDDDGTVHQEPVDVEDRDVWRAVNPAIHAGRGQGMAFLEEEFWRLGPDEFAQEHLCVWAPPPAGDGSPSSIPNWGQLVDESSVIESHLQWALAVSPVELGPQWASIGKAGRTAAGLLHVEWVEHRRGTHWIVETCRAHFEANGRVSLRVHANGPEGAFIDQLIEAGVEVDEVSTADVARATGAMIAAATGDPDDGVEPSLVHLGQASLSKAVRGAVLRSSPDGAVSWSQKTSTVEISPLKAVTVAAGGVPAETSSWLYA